MTRYRERYDDSASPRSSAKIRLIVLRASLVAPLAAIAAVTLSSLVHTAQTPSESVAESGPAATAPQPAMLTAALTGALRADDTAGAAAPQRAADLERERTERLWLAHYGRSDRVAEEAWLRDREHRLVRVAKGDTLMNLMMRAGVTRDEAVASVGALKKVYDPRRIWPGQEIALKFNPLAEDGPVFDGLTLDRSYDRRVVVARATGGTFEAKEVRKTLTEEPRIAAGTIRTSLFEAGAAAGLPDAVMIEMIRAFSFEVDFQREIQEGDSFEVLFEQIRDDSGEVVHQGKILYADLVLGGESNRIFRFTPKSGFQDFFHENGQSVRRALLRTPIDGARVSSGFGKRRHPILGYNKMHKGLDFAAPTGTPIFAAGDGIVERANRYGGYGNYVRLRHTDKYKTAYAHLHRFASGIASGKRVRQGQVIGYVGTSGRSTGPHLHYEVLVNGGQVNPLSVKLPAGEKLKGKDLDDFRLAKTEIERTYANLAGITRVAENASD